MVRSKEDISNYRKIYYLLHREELLAYGVVWRLLHPGYMSNYGKIWRLDNPDYYKIRALERYIETSGMNKKYSQNCTRHLIF